MMDHQNSGVPEFVPLDGRKSETSDLRWSSPRVTPELHQDPSKCSKHLSHTSQGTTSKDRCLSPVDNARCLDARLEFLGQGAELQRHDLRRDLEGVFDGAFNLLAGAGLIDAALELEREAQHVLVAPRQRLAFEIVDRGVAKYEVFEVAVIDVDAVDLEEAGGAMGVLDDRKDGKGSAAGSL